MQKVIIEGNHLSKPLLGYVTCIGDVLVKITTEYGQVLSFYLDGGHGYGYANGLSIKGVI